MTMHTVFKIGDITIHRIVEMEYPFYNPFEFLDGLTPELLDANRDWLEPVALDPATGKLVFCFQSYIVQTPQRTVMIDTCLGNDKARPRWADWHQKTDNTYLRNLAAAGFAPEDIDAVLCTHLHGDHVGWNTRLVDGRWVPTFPRARYVFSAAELEYWNARHAEAPVACMPDSVLPIVAAGRADLVRNDHAVDDFIRLLPTPGHTPNHVAIEIGRGGPQALMTGDLLHSPLQMRYPALSYTEDADRAQSAATRRRFLEHCCETAALCCTAHFPSPSVGRVTRWGDGFRCDPVD